MSAVHILVSDGDCIGGRIVIVENAPTKDDPEAEREIDLGPCPDWPGCGCQDDLPYQIDRAEGDR